MKNKLRGIVLYKVNDPQIITEAYLLAKEYEIKNFVIIGCTHKEAVPGIAFCSKNCIKDKINLMFFESIEDFIKSCCNENEIIGILSSECGEYIKPLDWIILGYIDYFEIKLYSLSIIKIGNNLGEIGKLATYLAVCYGKV